MKTQYQWHKDSYGGMSRTMGEFTLAQLSTYMDQDQYNTLKRCVQMAGNTPMKVMDICRGNGIELLIYTTTLGYLRLVEVDKQGMLQPAA